MAEAGQDLWESSSPKHCHMQLVARDHTQMASKDEDSTTSLGNRCECLVTSQWKSVSWYSEGTACVFVCTHCLWSCRHMHWWDLSELSPCWIPVLSLSSNDKCISPFIISLGLFWSLCSTSHFLLNWGSQNWTRHSRYVSAALSRGEGSPPLTCWWHSSQCRVREEMPRGLIFTHREKLMCTSLFKSPPDSSCTFQYMFHQNILQKIAVKSLDFTKPGHLLCSKDNSHSEKLASWIYFAGSWLTHMADSITAPIMPTYSSVWIWNVFV